MAPIVSIALVTKRMINNCTQVCSSCDHDPHSSSLIYNMNKQYIIMMMTCSMKYARIWWAYMGSCSILCLQADLFITHFQCILRPKMKYSLMSYSLCSSDRTTFSYPQNKSISNIMSMICQIETLKFIPWLICLQCPTSRRSWPRWRERTAGSSSKSSCASHMAQNFAR